MKMVGLTLVVEYCGWIGSDIVLERKINRASVIFKNTLQGLTLDLF